MYKELLIEAPTEDSFIRNKENISDESIVFHKEKDKITVGDDEYVAIPEGTKEGTILCSVDNNPTWLENSQIEECTATTIRINQNIADPCKMCSGEFGKYGTPLTNVISWIRANSHRYVGNYDTNDNIMKLKQLDDNDGTKYADGTDASEDIKGVNGGDVFVKIPPFWYKGTQPFEDDENIWDITFTKVNPNDDSWSSWSGNSLIGVYKGFCSDKSNNTVGIMRSISEKVPTVSISQTNLKSKARNRTIGNNRFLLVDFNVHNIMALLYIGYYGYNLNSAEVIGYTTNDKYFDNTGISDSYGMNDTIAEITFTNFWGLENWYSACFEYIDNMLISNNNNSNFLCTTDYSGNSRNEMIPLPIGNGYADKMILGDKCYLLPKSLNGTELTYFCDRQNCNASNNTTVARRGCTSNTDGGQGIFYVGCNISPTGTTDTVCGRIIYNGNSIII